MEDGNNKDNEIRIITTGGTFDKLYDEIRGELTFKDSHLPRILEQSRCTIKTNVENCLAIDSLYMNDEHRLKIAQSCERSQEHMIVVIHGTDTMVETAKVIAKQLGCDSGKTIVLTGAMVPYALESSDSVFNLGCAITAVQIKGPGVYICMSGRIFDYDNVRKNKAKGIFETLD